MRWRKVVVQLRRTSAALYCYVNTGLSPQSHSCCVSSPPIRVIRDNDVVFVTCHSESKLLLDHLAASLGVYGASLMVRRWNSPFE